MQTAIQAIYEHGMLKPRKKLPIREWGRRSGSPQFWPVGIPQVGR